MKNPLFCPGNHFHTRRQSHPPCAFAPSPTTVPPRPLDRVTFTVGSDYQYSKQCNIDKFKLIAMTSEHDTRKAGAEVVKQAISPPLSRLLYPLRQALDEEYLAGDRVWAESDTAGFTIRTAEGFGGVLTSFASADELEAAYARGEVHPGDLKVAVIIAINALLVPIQKALDTLTFRNITALAYPVEKKAVTKKKVKAYVPKPECLLTEVEKDARRAAGGGT